jgi:hypothetical protein
MKAAEFEMRSGFSAAFEVSTGKADPDFQEDPKADRK